MAANDPVNDLKAVGGIIRKIIQSCRPEAGETLGRIGTVWSQVVGAVIADNPRPAAIKGNVLLVYVNSSPWIHQLQFFKADIISGLNNTLETHLVDDIKFKIGPV